MKINQQGLHLIKQFEGCRLSSYKDQVGVWTVGYGHTGGDVYRGLNITQNEADSLLEVDLEKFESQVEDLVTCPLNDSQFSALVSFAYNLGINSLARSTLLKLVNQSNFYDASNEFLKWSNAGGIHSPGLLRRRTAEKALFLS